MSVAPLDEHRVDALCRAAVTERGDPDVVVRAHLRRTTIETTEAGDVRIDASARRAWLRD